MSESECYSKMEKSFNLPFPEKMALMLKKKKDLTESKERKDDVCKKSG